MRPASWAFDFRGKKLAGQLHKQNDFVIHVVTQRLRVIAPTFTVLLEDLRAFERAR